MSDLIRRADAIEAVMAEGRKVYTSEYANAEWVIYEEDAVEALSMLPSAEAVSREEYEETDGVITIENQSAKDVGEIKHIVIRSPNYTRYFYNESMPLPAETVCVPERKDVVSGIGVLNEEKGEKSNGRNKHQSSDAVQFLRQVPEYEYRRDEMLQW